MIEHFDRDLFKKCIPYFDKPPVIFDIGAHEGHYTKFVLEIIPDAKTWLFEPNEELFKKLFGDYITSLPYAMSDSNKEEKFYLCHEKNNELSSLYKREVFDQTGFTEVIIKCTTVDYFSASMSVEQIDFVKIDVEGSELDVLNGCPRMMREKRIKFIQVEYGGTYKDADILFTQVIITANLFGYKVYELINNNLTEVTEENFIEDYRYTIFLLTYIKC